MRRYAFPRPVGSMTSFESPAGGRIRPRFHDQLQLVFEGGPEGKRRAALLFFTWVGPVGLVVHTVLSTDRRPQIIAARVLFLAAAILWLLLRKQFTRGEWMGLLALVAVSNTVGQLAAGPSHSGVPALSSIGVVALVCVAFESDMVVFTSVLFWVCYAVVQFHFYSAVNASAATLMYLVIIGLLALVVHGTALYLRDSLRRTEQLNLQMERTAEQERARIAGDLHDDTIQVLTAAGLRLDELGRKLETARDTHSAASARDVRDLIGRALERTRRLTFELYPPQLDTGGLPSALEALGQQVESDSSFSVAVSVTCDGVPRDAEQLIYRTVKELLINAGKHSQARNVAIAVTAEQGLVRGVVEDDGRGFDSNKLAEARQAFHLGLDATANRLQAAGGTFRIDSDRDRGTRASFTLPFAVGEG